MEKCNRCKKENIIRDLESKFHNIYKCADCNYTTTKRIEDCCRNPFLNVTIDDKNQERKRLHRQCMNCGGCVDRTKPLSFKKHSDEIRYEFSYLNYNNWLKEREYEREALWDWISENNYYTSDYAKYREYLNSDIWKLKRKGVLIRDENLCQECKIKPAEEVHHKTYENLYNEPLEDLIAVCKDCHKEIHRILDMDKMEEIRKQMEIHLKSQPTRT